jgi:hypothetical protein
MAGTKPGHDEVKWGVNGGAKQSLVPPPGHDGVE